MMICPKCGTRQERSDACVQCGIIFEKFKKIYGTKNEAGTEHKIASISGIFTKLVLYPIIALLAVYLLYRWFPERAVLSRPFTVYAFFGVPALIFGIAGIKHLIKGFILYRKIDGDMWILLLAAGLLLSAVFIVTTTWIGISDYNLRQSKKRYKMAVDQIQQIRWCIIDYLAIPSNILPPGNENPEMLRSRAPDCFPREVSLIDPWGKPYRYRVEQSSIYVWSSGPDGLDDTDDDVDTNSPRYRWHYWHWPAA